MSRRRRAALLLGLALVLGALAASDVARREAALRAQLAPLVRRGRRPPGRSRPATGSRRRDLARPRACRRASRRRRGRRAARAAGRPPARGARRRGRPRRPLLLEPPAPPRRRAACGRGRAGGGGRRGGRAGHRRRGRSRRRARHARPRRRRGRDGARAAGRRGAGRARPAADGARRDGGAARSPRRCASRLRQAVYLAAAGAFAREIRLLARRAGRPPPGRGDLGRGVSAPGSRRRAAGAARLRVAAAQDEGNCAG